MAIVFSDDLTRFAQTVLMAVGMREDAAACAARCFVDADKRGIATHGVFRLGAYADALARGMIDARAIPVVEPRGAIRLVDGRNALGPVVATAAMEAAMEAARTSGVGIALARNSNHFGAGASHVARAAAAGMVGLAMSNAAPTMATYGGRDAVIGTNPIAAAVPAGREPPFLLDMATSVVSRGSLRAAARDGVAIDPDWAVTADGRPARTAEEALGGALRPFGGAKGSGLAILVDLLAGVLSGAEFGDGVRLMYGGHGEKAGVGHVFLVIDVAAIMPLAAFVERYDRLIAGIRAAQPADGFAAVAIPGERAAEALERSVRDGIRLSDALYRDLVALAAHHDLPPPPKRD